MSGLKQDLASDTDQKYLAPESCMCIHEKVWLSIN